MKQPNLNDIISNQLKLSYTLNLPESAPNSLISSTCSETLNNENIYDVILKSTKELYEKYIDPSKAILEVNISSDKRVALMKVFKSLESTNDKKNVVQQILPLLENAVLEVSYLMNDSNQRFRRTSVFLELVELEQE